MAKRWHRTCSWLKLFLLVDILLVRRASVLWVHQTRNFIRPSCFSFDRARIVSDALSNQFINRFGHHDHLPSWRFQKHLLRRHLQRLSFPKWLWLDCSLFLLTAWNFGWFFYFGFVLFVVHLLVESQQKAGRLFWQRNMGLDGSCWLLLLSLWLWHWNFSSSSTCHLVRFLPSHVVWLQIEIFWQHRPNTLPWLVLIEN